VASGPGLEEGARADRQRDRHRQTEGCGRSGHGGPRPPAAQVDPRPPLRELQDREPAQHRRRPRERRDSEDGYAAARGEHERGGLATVWAVRAAPVAQRKREAEHEEREQRLLERALGVIGRGQVRHAGQRRGRDAQVPACALERGERRQGRQHRRGNQQARERRRRSDAEASLERRDQRVGAVRVVGRGDMRCRAERAQRVGLAHVEREIVEDVRAQLAHPLVGYERQRAEREHRRADRHALDERS
jgi:hypothetical protein